MKLFLKKYFILIVLIFISATSFADKGPPHPLDPGPPGLSLDSNSYILFLFAMALGLYKLYQFKKHKKTPN